MAATHTSVYTARILPYTQRGAVRDPEGGAYVVRIRKIGPGVTLEILGTDVSATISDILEAAPFLSQVPTRIFFGNAFGDYPFSDMRVLPERPHGRGKGKWPIPGGAEGLEFGFEPWAARPDVAAAGVL